MSIFASKTTGNPIPIPFDPPHTVTVRTLTGREVELAQEAHARGIAIGRSRLWNERFKRILANGTADEAEMQEILRDPLTGYDRFAVARFGIVAWTYPTSLKATPAIPAVPAADGKPEQPAIPAYDPIEDLVDDAVEFIAREVMRKTKPHLFQGEAEAQASQKEAEGVSSSSGR